MDQELHRRLKSADPARPTPVSLNAVIDELASQPTTRRRRWWLPVVATGSALVLAGGLAAATDIDAYLLSVPPFSTLAEGTVQPVSGLPYVSQGETDRGEQCALYIDLGGLSDEEFTAVSDYWASADPEVFAAGIESRLGVIPTTDDEEWQAIQDQILEDLDPLVPGITWGAAAPSKPFSQGEPHLVSVSRVCEDDLDSFGLAG
ncbi:hypothetical protein AB4Y63_12025 [Leifsonia sp. YAF41]|uniref:hypothetical protein n=1 Tax=Leifsonia sp. YAF41 TaxID=3233086 RepID=UPI003F94DD02